MQRRDPFRSLRVLVLSYETPAHPAGGGPSRQHALLEPLATRHAIRVVSTGGRPTFGRPPDHVQMRLLDPGPPLGATDEPWLRKHVRHYLVGGPWLYRLAQHHVNALRAVIGEEIASFDPELVVVEHEELAPLLDAFPDGVPTVMVFHNLLLEVQRQRLRRGPVIDRLKAVLELPVLAREERRALKRAAVSVVVSGPNERMARRLRPSARIALIPNCVDVEYFRRTAPPADHPVIALSASYHYPPNQEAAREIVTRVLPQVRSRVRDVELALIGQRMPDELRSLAAATPGVRVVGSVPDIRPELQRAWVALAPLRTGSGSPLKVLEALAMGVPVVGTPRVASALELGEDDGVVVARRSGEIATAIVSLLKDDERRMRLAQGGEACVRLRFDRTVVAAALEREWFAAARATKEA